jgi:hypothetical protein
VSKVENYRQRLESFNSWDEFLLSESNLPGPRANLELAFAVAMEGTEEQLLRYAKMTSEDAPGNTPGEFLAVCGVVGLGYLAARGEGEHFSLLREKASDPRWRIREAVALGLQKFGERSVETLLRLMHAWSTGSLLEKRAVVATLCEPKLLRDPAAASDTLDLLDEITESLLAESDRRTEAFKILRKGLAYGWSVVVASQPELGKPRMAKWIRSEDSDIRWIMVQNLKKKRLRKMDASWVESQLATLKQ